MIRRTTRFVPPAVVSAGTLLALTAAGQSPPSPTATHTTPSSLTRLLRLYDFEEAEDAPHTMPINFYRYLAPEKGFPEFGSMQLTSESAHGGRWSFRFETDGGSLSARVPTAMLGVLPGGDYVVSAWIRTVGLTHARARIAAGLYDARGNLIPESRVSSPLCRTDGRWQHVSVELYGDFEDAADLVVELELLQPQQFTRRQAGPAQPLHQDLAAQAWFDDVAAWQRPRIELTTDSPGNVVSATETARLNLFVRDPLPGGLMGRLRIYDLRGEPVHDESFELPQGVWRNQVELRQFEYGWYRAVLEVSDRDNVLASHSLNITLLPPRRRSSATREPLFGVVLKTMPQEDIPTIVEMVRHLNIGSATIPLTSETTGAGGVSKAMLEQLVEQLLSLNHMELTMSVKRLPADLSAQAGLDPTQVLQLLGREQAHRRDLLEMIPINVGLKVPRWLLGMPGSLRTMPQTRLESLLKSTRQALEQFLRAPIIYVPAWAEEELVPLPRGNRYWVTVPYQIQPAALELYASRWPIKQDPVHTTLIRLPPESYPPLERVIDLSLRTLYGWKAGLPHMAITPPWTRQLRPRPQMMPDPSYAAWRVLAQQLEGRTFAGPLPIAAGVHCWILSTPGSGDTALVAWSDRDDAEEPHIRLHLASGPVDVVDLLGNRRSIKPHDGVHTVTLGRLPLFIEKINGSLARFRAGFSIEPGFVPARHQRQDHRIIMSNPWPVAISGTIRLQPAPGWRIMPRSQRFSIPPGEQTQLPIEVVLGRNMLAGPARVEAQVQLTADRDYRLVISTDLEVGLKNVEFASGWRVAGDDLIVSLAVTNTGAEPLYLQAYVSAPGISQHRRPFATLDAGQTAVRTFRLEGGANILAGSRIHLGVTERGGSARLNRVLDIPALLEN